MAHGHTRQLAAAAGLVCASLVVWVAHTVCFGGSAWNWYLWNLWLALIPVALSTVLAQRYAMRSPLPWPLLLLGGAVWLLFFPNAAYLVTDIVHLPRVTWTPRFTVEAAMILLFACAGAMLALVSLAQVRDVVLHHLPVGDGARRTRIEAVFVVVVAVLNGFGIALGRLARSNSWDVWTAPQQLVGDVVTTATSPQGLTVTAVASVLLVGAHVFVSPAR